jgi:hypothetical protein
VLVGGRMGFAAKNLIIYAVEVAKNARRVRAANAWPPHGGRTRPRLAGADAGHITFGSDFPFAPLPARKYFADNLDNYDGL